jgi:hypothetical protein
VLEIGARTGQVTLELGDAGRIARQSTQPRAYRHSHGSGSDDQTDQ